MKSIRWFTFIIILLTLLASCAPAVSIDVDEESAITPSIPNPASEATNPTENLPAETSTPNITSESSTDKTNNPLSDLYDCKMRLRFTSGPLENKSMGFTVLGEDYFLDKGDKFAPGKGASIYYEPQRYLIVHSSYVNGNILRPMEAESLRKHLEGWGRSSAETIQGQIDSLLGSEVYWTCDDGLLMTAQITGITRLSHEASQRLWLEPENLTDILTAREGAAAEWLGEIEPGNDNALYMGFCGWGPETTANGRYTYYRYLIQFTPVK